MGDGEAEERLDKAKEVSKHAKFVDVDDCSEDSDEDCKAVEVSLGLLFPGPGEAVD